MAELLPQIRTLLLEHIWMTVIAMLIATAIALPLGIYAAERPGVAHWLIGGANVVQTIPSLALFGLLLPLPWLGAQASRIAIVALAGYALLPILRNTYEGLRGIDPNLLDAAEALGLSWWQRLRIVRLPLAGSYILAGIRTATVICVGIATIAAAVGAGGLGELIFRGVASVDNRLVLAGALPAAALALLADGTLGLAERGLRKSTT
jgi:osmoprotectant transport system permease protein